MDSYEMVHDQKLIHNEMCEIVDDFEKNIGSRTKQKIQDKLRRLNELWNRFEKNHAEILKTTKSDTPYMERNAYENTKKYYEESFFLIQNWKTSNLSGGGTASVKTSAKDSDPTGSTTIAPAPRSASNISSALNLGNAPEDSERELDIRVRKQKIKLMNLNIAINQLSKLFGTNISAELLESKRKFITAQWIAIAELHEEILLESTGSLGEYLTNNVFEDAFNCMANALDTLSNGVTSSTNGVINPITVDNKLPPLKMPVFSGNYLDWTTFSDVFKSLIHNKTTLSLAEKFEYLKTYVDREALRLISPYSLSGSNPKFVRRNQ